MKVFVVMLTAVVCIIAAFTIYEISAVHDEQDRLAGEVRAIASATDDLTASMEDEEEPSKWNELDLRLARLEEKLGALTGKDESTQATDLAAIEATVRSQGEEIAQLRKDLEGARRVRGALDDTADRLMSAVGQDSGAAEGQQGGLNRLMELGALFQKRPEDLTEEEKARREEVTSQLRKRQGEWAVRSFDRSLQAKLDDQQKADLQQALEDERAALDASRGQDLTAEERTAARQQVQAKTDQRAAAVLSAEQYESWKTYRARSSSARPFGFGRSGSSE